MEAEQQTDQEVGGLGIFLVSLPLSLVSVFMGVFPGPGLARPSAPPGDTTVWRG